MPHVVGSWPLAAALALTLAVAAGANQEHPREPHRHAEGKQLGNPAPSSPESVERGRTIYAKSCASCHGANGFGNGRLAAAMAAYGARPSDLTDAEWQHGSTDGEIFLIIRDGVGPDFHMPRFEGQLADAAVWDVVNFVRTLGM